MTYRIAVCYGHPDDPAAFDDHYRTTHIPLAREVPGLSAYTWGKCAPIGGSPTPYYVVANLIIPDRGSDAAGTRLGADAESRKRPVQLRDR